MKQRITFMLAVVAVFTFAIAAFAYNRGAVSFAFDNMSCCKKDSCPMKKKDASGKEAASCCDNCDCCKDGKCTGDSCPMKKHDAKATTVSASSETKNCCDDCDCCKGKHDMAA